MDAEWKNRMMAVPPRMIGSKLCIAAVPDIYRGCAHFFLAACFLTYLVFFFFCRSLLRNSQSNK